MRRGHALPVVALLVVIASAPVAAAQPFPVLDVPPELRPWIPWVMDEVPDAGCPRVQGRTVCAWPGRLTVEAGAAGGSFALELYADRASDLRLPGGAEAWPQQVRLDGAAAPVFPRDAAPTLRVGPGRHRVEARFIWSRMPESLVVPPEIGLLALRLDGRDVPEPRRESGGLLWLRALAHPGAEGESLRLQVFRRVEDGVPLFVETRLQLEVAGRAREVALAGALLPDTVPVAVTGDLPARVEDGVLRLQLRGGRFAVSVRARVDGRPAGLKRPKTTPAEPWPAREVWVFAADERLRQVELSGPPPIDPSRTELPEAWQKLPAFLVEPGQALSFREVRRGESQAAPDTLQLARELWLDPDGRSASVRDHLTGTLRGRSRLDLLPPGALGRVAVDGQDQLVTAGPDGRAGVELRRQALNLTADSRLALSTALPAVGWSADVEQLSATLNLPPGWTLLGAAGVDRLPGAWTARWTLLGFFVVLLIAIAVLRLFGPVQAMVALAALVLTHGEPGAPFAAWLSLVAAVALQRVAPAERIQRLARAWRLASAGVLLVVLVPFARDQLRDAIFPQAAVAEEAGLSVPGGVVGAVVGGLPSQLPVAPAAAPAEAQGEATNEPAARGRDALQSSVSRPKASALAQELKAERLDEATRFSFNQALAQDPKAVLQTGPGVPTWRWRSYALGWTGPVGPEHRIRLALASPGLNRLLTLLRLLGVAALGFLLAVGRWPRLPHRTAAGAPPSPAGLAALASLSLLGAAGIADGEPNEPVRTPSAEVLAQLRQKLTRPPSCEPACLTTPSLLLRIADTRLEVHAEVHAAADGAWAVPGPLASWAPAELRLDGAPATAVAHLADGFLHVRVPRGVHQLDASGPLPAADSIALQFVDPPRRARAETAGWDVSGLRADGPAASSILLTRRLATHGAGARALGEGRYPAWLEVTRTLGFGVTWTVETRVRRLTPLGTPVALRVPLLPGEAPTRPDLVVEDGQAAVSLGGDEAETAWQSALAQTPTITLHAPEGRSWSEVWRLQCSAIWPCDASGLPPVARVSGGVLGSEYRPWPGESLQVSLRHPQGVEGQTLTVDDLDLESIPGSRLERVTLRLSARSSREQPLVLQIPREAELQALSLDGQERPARPEGGELRVTVPVGAHVVEARWHQARGVGVFHPLPRVRLSVPAVNVTKRLRLPPERWLLLTHGPSWGPAVLFWPYLVFVLAAAAALGRLPGGPLTSAQWLLLGLGLSQLPSLGALFVAAFLLALSLRGRRSPRAAWLFDLTQIGLGAGALVSLLLLYLAIQQGLLLRPDMQVAGNGSSDGLLSWYAERTSADLPGAGVVSLPLWAYRVVMLLWALWLAHGLVRAVGPGWRAFGHGGYWRPLLLKRRATPATAAVDDSPVEDQPRA